MTAIDLNSLVFDNRFINELPADPEPLNTRRQVFNACYSLVQATPVANPRLVAYAKDVAQLLDLTDTVCESPEFTQVFAGNRLVNGMSPYATCYGGHQFGHWAGQLGDGRAINLGDVINQRGERWALQLKGAGATPYSRNADGLAVLRSSIREFLCSEAMFHLGIPTTRALSIILTGEEVIRDMFYDGNPETEPGAVVCRVAPSFTRFGHFQIFAARQDLKVLQQLLDYTLRTDFPELAVEPSPAGYLAWFSEVCRRTAQMIVHWQRVGFVHGVMNTDNMSILGLTIDYGPYGWLDNFDLNWTPNTTDASERRYRYGNQPSIAFWNLAQLANAIFPLLREQDLPALQAALNVYKETFEHEWQAMMASKLGFKTFAANTDHALCSDLFEILQSVETDMSIFYRQLATFTPNPSQHDAELILPFMAAYYVPDQLNIAYQVRLGDWLRRYGKRLASEAWSDEARRRCMNAVNPNYVLRNYLAQLAIDEATTGDFSMVNTLLEILRHPYDEQTKHQQFAAKRPDWARQRAGCSMLSCSS